MAEAELKAVKEIIKCLVIPNPDGISFGRLRGDYRDEEGQEIPYQKFGYTSLNSFLAKEMADTVYFGYCKDGTQVVKAYIDDKTAHVQALVKGQKKTKKRPNGSSGGFRPIGSHNRLNPSLRPGFRPVTSSSSSTFRRPVYPSLHRDPYSQSSQGFRPRNGQSCNGGTGRIISGFPSCTQSVAPADINWGGDEKKPGGKSSDPDWGSLNKCVSATPVRTIHADQMPLMKKEPIMTPASTIDVNRIKNLRVAKSSLNASIPNNVRRQLLAFLKEHYPNKLTLLNFCSLWESKYRNPKNESYVKEFEYTKYGFISLFQSLKSVPEVATIECSIRSPQTVILSEEALIQDDDDESWFLDPLESASKPTTVPNIKISSLENIKPDPDSPEKKEQMPSSQAVSSSPKIINTLDSSQITTSTPVPRTSIMHVPIPSQPNPPSPVSPIISPSSAGHVSLGRGRGLRCVETSGEPAGPGIPSSTLSIENGSCYENINRFQRSILTIANVRAAQKWFREQKEREERVSITTRTNGTTEKEEIEKEPTGAVPKEKVTGHQQKAEERNEKSYTIKGGGDAGDKISDKNNLNPGNLHGINGCPVRSPHDQIQNNKNHRVSQTVSRGAMRPNVLPAHESPVDQLTEILSRHNLNSSSAPSITASVSTKKSKVIRLITIGELTDAMKTVPSGHLNTFRNILKCAPKNGIPAHEFFVLFEHLTHTSFDPINYGV